MAIFQRPELDIHIVYELIDDINDHYEISENALIELEQSPDDREMTRTLYRSVHTIKGDLGVVGFSPAIPLVAAVEELLALLLDGSLAYDTLISDLVLLMLDKVKMLVENFRRDGQLEYQPDEYDGLREKLADLKSLPPQQQQEIVAEQVRCFDPGVVERLEDFEPLDFQEDELLQDQSLADDNDLQFFRALMEPVEARSEYWHGRSDRILKMALILNQLGGNPVDKLQLAVAVYAHDFGMAFMPLDILHKESVLSDQDILLLRSHVTCSANLLQHMEKWRPAAEIVMQHHEAVNGSGYPVGLRDKEICEGAKILAIADTFDALTHQRASASHQKRPIIRAVKEINDCAGKTLCSYWVNIFNQAVEPVLSEYRARQSE